MVRRAENLEEFLDEDGISVSQSDERVVRRVIDNVGNDEDEDVNALNDEVKYILYNERRMIKSN